MADEALIAADEFDKISAITHYVVDAMLGYELGYIEIRDKLRRRW